MILRCVMSKSLLPITFCLSLIHHNDNMNRGRGIFYSKKGKYVPQTLPSDAHLVTKTQTTYKRKKALDTTIVFKIHC